MTIKSGKTSKGKTSTRRRGFSKEKILAIGTRLFAEQGYSALSIRDIAAACKVNIPSIYHFFGGKENLYDACCDAAFANSAAKLNSSLVAVTGAKARVRQFTITLSEILLENQDFRRLLLHEIIMRDESRHYDQLTTHFFVKEFRMLVNEIAELDGAAQASEHAFSIYALTFGLIILQRIAEVARVDASPALNFTQLAERVLSIVLPHQNWAAERPAKPPRR